MENTREMHGFTFIELMVTIALLASIATVIILDPTGSRSAVKMETATRLMESQLRYVQQLGTGGRAFPPGTAR